jgi:hypothetical protein
VTELTEAVGDGVLLHPVHPRLAPKHRRTTGRPWLLTPEVMFNLAGLPVTEVPLGLSVAGLPLGVQVAAGLDRDPFRSRSRSSSSGCSAAGSRRPSREGLGAFDGNRGECRTGRTLKHDGDPLPGSPSLIPPFAPTAGLGTPI